MTSRYVTFLALLGLLVLPISCGDAGGTKLTSSNSKTVQMLESARSSFVNFGAALQSQSATPTCTGTGLPTVAFGTGSYYLQAFPCAFKIDSKNPETILGTISFYSSVMCAIEDQVKFNYATSATTHSVTLDALDPCFSGISLGGGNGTYPVVVQERALLGGASNWSYKITVDLPNNAGLNPAYSGKKITIFIRDGGNKTGIKVSMGSNGGGDSLGLFLDTDTTTNTFRFDLYSGSDLKHHRGVMTSNDSRYSSIAVFYGAHSVGSGSPVLNFKATSGVNSYQSTTGDCLNCAGLTPAPALAFSNFATGDLSGRLQSEGDAPLTFNTALPDQFLP
jgi:hypothetical protein